MRCPLIVTSESISDESSPLIAQLQFVEVYELNCGVQPERGRQRTDLLSRRNHTCVVSVLA